MVLQSLKLNTMCCHLKDTCQNDNYCILDVKLVIKSISYKMEYIFSY